MIDLQRLKSPGRPPTLSTRIFHYRAGCNLCAVVLGLESSCIVYQKVWLWSSTSYTFLTIIKDTISSIHSVKHINKNDKLYVYGFDRKHIKRTINECVIHDDHAENILPLEHEVLKVTLRSSETIAVDLSCAQYGELVAVSEWSNYQTSRTDKSFLTTERAENSQVASYTTWMIVA